jgi:bacterioferritin
MAENNQKLNTEQVIGVLNRILELELAGVVRFMHYSFMVFGYNRIPVIKWLHDQATEALAHAQLAGEHVTSLGGHPSLGIGPLLESRKHDLESILKECAHHEQEGLQEYHRLLEHVRDRNIMLEEYARNMIASEEQHLNEIGKMLRRPEPSASK